MGNVRVTKPMKNDIASLEPSPKNISMIISAIYKTYDSATADELLEDLLELDGGYKANKINSVRALAYKRAMQKERSAK